MEYAGSTPALGAGRPSSILGIPTIKFCMPVVALSATRQPVRREGGKRRVRLLFRAGRPKFNQAFSADPPKKRVLGIPTIRLVASLLAHGLRPLSTVLFEDYEDI